MARTLDPIHKEFVDNNPTKGYNKNMNHVTDPHNLTAQELELIHQAGWHESPFGDLPVKFYHPTLKDPKTRMFLRFDGAQVLEMIKKNMQDTFRQGLDY
jgi:hypothetical protein